MRMGIRALHVCLVLIFCANHASAVVSSGDLFYASGAMGAPAQVSGTAIAPTQFIGVRFSVIQPTTISWIGGHFYGVPSGNNLIFSSLIHLDDLYDYPDSLDLSSPDVLTTTTFTTPQVSADIAVPITSQTLVPGVYGLLYGSGLFGATGHSALPSNGVNNGAPSIFWLDSTGTWREGGLAPLRLTVYTPEPGSAMLVLGCATGLIRRRRKAINPTSIAAAL